MNEKQIESFYKRILKIIENKIGNKTTFLSQLHHIGKSMFGKRFHGVYPSDKITILKSGQSCILNLDSSNQPGSHWIGLYKKGKKTYIYDSFGRNHTKIIYDLKFSGNGKIIDCDRDPEQKKSEYNCGQRCLAWLYCIYKKGIENAILI